MQTEKCRCSATRSGPKASWSDSPCACLKARKSHNECRTTPLFSNHIHATIHLVFFIVSFLAAIRPSHVFTLLVLSLQVLQKHSLGLAGDHLYNPRDDYSNWSSIQSLEFIIIQGLDYNLSKFIRYALSLVPTVFKLVHYYSSALWMLGKYFYL